MLPKVLYNIVCDYVDGDIIIEEIEKKMKWIDWFSLSSNKNAIHIIERNIDKINWNTICKNENAIHIIEKNITNIGYYNETLNSNVNAIELLKKYPNKIIWSSLIKNKNATKFIKEKLYNNGICTNIFSNIDWLILCRDSETTEQLSIIDDILEHGETHPYYNNIDFELLSKNKNATHILKKYFSSKKNYMDINGLCENNNMIDIIENIIEDKKNIFDKTFFGHLCKNENAIHIIEKIINKNPESRKINWYCLSTNKNMVHILEKYPEKISWFYILGNENGGKIFENNLDKINFSSVRFYKNKESIKILEKIINNGHSNIYYRKINWNQLCNNITIHNKHLIENNIHLLNKSHFQLICTSELMIDIIIKNLDKLDEPCWKNLCSNEQFWDKYVDKLLRNIIY